MLSQPLIKYWSIPRKAHSLCRSPRNIPYYTSREISLLISPPNDVYNFRVIATINEFHSPIGVARWAGKFRKIYSIAPAIFFPSWPFSQFARMIRAQKNRIAIVLRLKGSLASSFAMYQAASPDCRYYCHNFAIIRLGNFQTRSLSFPFDFSSSSIISSMSLSFSLSLPSKLHVKRSGL